MTIDQKIISCEERISSLDKEITTRVSQLDNYQTEVKQKGSEQLNERRLLEIIKVKN